MATKLRGQVIADHCSGRFEQSTGLERAARGRTKQKRLSSRCRYLPLIEPSEAAALAALDFERERKATGDYWRGVLNRERPPHHPGTCPQ